MDDHVFEMMFRESVISKISTEECLTNYYKKQGYNIFIAAEYAQYNRLNFVEFVNKAISNSRILNIPYIFSDASKDVVTINYDYFHVKKIEGCLKIMNWRDFELISGSILEICFGAVDVKITSSTADGGVDFEGRIPIRSIQSSSIYGFIEVYGQVKRYASNVGIYDIKSFVAFANSKKRNYVHPAQLFVFFTSSDYAPNALNELNTNGFIGFSGLQLANLIYNYKDALSKKSLIIHNVFVKLDLDTA